MTSPALVALTKALYGDAVDPVEFAKSVDVADVHVEAPLAAAKRRKVKPGTDQLVPAPVKVAQAMVSPAPIAKFSGDPDKRGRKAAAIGLGASGVATVAGIHALTASRGEGKHRAAALEGKPPPMKTPGKLATRLAGKVGPKKAAAIIGGGLLGLHGVELVGDALAIHTQANQLKRTKKPVAKGVVKLSLKPVNPQQVRKVVSLKARRPPGSPAPVAKGLIRNAKSTAANAEQISGKVAKLVPKPKTAALGAVGLVTLSGGVNALGTYKGAKAGVKRGLAKEFTAPVEIAKRDDERQQVFGWANVSVMDGALVVDRQGDVIPIEELEKAAYGYVLSSRVGADQHQRISKWALDTDLGPKQTATMIESMVFTPEKIEKMGLPPDFPQAWWVGYQIQDPTVWADIKAGRRTGFSIHGVGRRTPVGEIQKDLQLRERTRQAIHPPPVKRRQVDSAAMRSVGYQPQTRKLDIQMRSRTEPYSYRVHQQTADAILQAPSKGKAYHEHIRNKAPHHTRYRLSDRARLFAKPDQVEKADRKTKALMGGVIGGSATAVGASTVKVHRALKVRDAARQGAFELGTERRALKQALRPANRATAAGLGVALGSAGGLAALGHHRSRRPQS